MAQDYGKLKNAELEGLLKQRGLTHTGKKADLVARLVEDDSKVPSAATNDAEDEIDWGDDEPAAAPAPATAAEAEPAVDASAPVKAPEDTAEAAVEPAPAAEVAEQQAPEVEAMEVDVDAELQARIARIDKFTNPGDPDSLKWAEEEKAKIMRLQKSDSGGFAKEKLSSQATTIASALPERREKGEKRRRGNDEGAARRGGRTSGRGDDPHRHHPYRGHRGGNRGDRRPQNSGGAQREKTGSNWMTDNDRAAAEARKNRFA